MSEQLLGALTGFRRQIQTRRRTLNLYLVRRKISMLVPRPYVEQ